MGLKLITPPDSAPVTLEEVKAQLNIDYNDEDTMLEAMIIAATDSLDGPNGDLCGRALKPQTWDLTLDAFPGDIYSYPLALATNNIRIPLPPLIEVESVNYVDSDTELEVELAVGEYEVDLIGTPYGWVAPGSAGWPTPMTTLNAVRVRFVAGYPDTDSPIATTVPTPIRQAIIMIVMDMYGRGSAFVDRTQTPNRDTIEALTKHYVIRTVA